MPTLMLKYAISPCEVCCVGKVCGPLWWFWGAPLGEGKFGVKVGIVNTKVAHRANNPPEPSLWSLPRPCGASWGGAASTAENLNF